MTEVLNRFNWIARHYDLMTRLVFGRAISNSQICFLPSIPRAARILIIGGGSGEILTTLMTSDPLCKIWYVEASSEMLTLAAERIPAGEKNRLIFIHGTESALPEGIEFDVIITNFFLDLFPGQEEAAICHLLSRKLRSRGVWLVTDFVDGGKWWHGFLLWTMYRFFANTCSIKAAKLPDWESHVIAAGMVIKACRSFYGGFIKSAFYQKAT